jgi:predicted RNA-binding protein with PIN domain
MKYILDGYNILFREKTKNESFEEQRIRFFERLNSLIETLHLNLTVVLDSHLQDSEWQRHHFHSLEIIYTDYKETADEYIVSYVEHLPPNKRDQIKVVTSDRNLTQKVRLERVEVLSVSDFFKEIEKKTRSQRLKKRISKSPQVTPQKEKNTFPPLSDNKSWIALFERRIQKLPEENAY